jgi:hypothetical protein
LGRRVALEFAGAFSAPDRVGVFLLADALRPVRRVVQRQLHFPLVGDGAVFRLAAEALPPVVRDNLARAPPMNLAKG